MEKAFSFFGRISKGASFDVSTMRTDLSNVAGAAVHVQEDHGACLVSGRIKAENIPAVRKRMKELGIIEGE